MAFARWCHVGGVSHTHTHNTMRAPPPIQFLAQHGARDEARIVNSPRRLRDGDGDGDDGNEFPCVCACVSLRLLRPLNRPSARPCARPARVCVCVCVCVSAWLHVRPPARLSARSFARQCLLLSTRLSACPSVCPPVCVAARLSTFQFCVHVCSFVPARPPAYPTPTTTSAHPRQVTGSICRWKRTRWTRDQPRPSKRARGLKHTTNKKRKTSGNFAEVLGTS